MSIPKKNDYMINPLTKRNIRVGSRIWINLVKDGVIQGQYSDDNILAETEEIDDNTITDKINELNESLPIGVRAVKGRGRYENKIVKRHSQITHQDMAKSTAKKTSKILSKNLEELSDLSQEDMESELERLILSEIMLGKPEIVRSKPIKIPVKSAIKRDSYYEVEPDEFDEEEEEDDEYYS
jgi:hypothetical protein